MISLLEAIGVPLPGALLEPWVRALLAAATSLVAVLVAGSWFIGYMARRRVLEHTQRGDSERLDALHASKSATPTLGGLVVFSAVILSALAWTRAAEKEVLLLVGFTAALAALGFLDDARKLRTRKGLKARVKLRAQISLSLAAGLLLYAFPAEVLDPATGAPSPTALFLPFPKGASLELGAASILLVVLVTTGASNAVNLTDGLDGLAMGTSLLVAAVLAFAAFLVGDPGASRHLELPHVACGGEVGVFLGALIGAGLGFLWFNCHPARVFMGDTGALPLGGALGLAAELLKQDVLLLEAGGVLVAEALSATMQLLAFKTTGRRIFLIAPLH
ncbi:MAG: phospho-N-acetylmuramoyl-pentapeptide-transferase, partial [Planctomycetes bacterium]|nr:phospho-N-acetylmuramoyl-pentapeptide-transferase [Planctomycetota bacterium]